MGQNEFSGKRALMVDNYDSFTYNIVQYYAQLGVDITTVRNDAVALDQLNHFDFVIISPGPADPDQAGQSLEVIRLCAEKKIPLIGICLGHQCIGQYFGSKVVKFDPPHHGKVSAIRHNQQGIYTGLPTPLQATRYHSLVVDRASLPADLIISGESEDGVIQSMFHKEKPLVGIQYHPESVLTERGLDLLANFVRQYC